MRKVIALGGADTRRLLDILAEIDKEKTLKIAETFRANKDE